MGRSDRKSDEPDGSGDASGATKNDAADRPGASGHRFGPELACSECGISWDVHQREPKPCRTEFAPDVFARRPTAPFDDDASTASESVASAKERDES